MMENVLAHFIDIMPDAVRYFIHRSGFCPVVETDSIT